MITLLRIPLIHSILYGQGTMPVSMIYCIAWAMIPVYGGVYSEEGKNHNIGDIARKISNADILYWN